MRVSNPMLRMQKDKQVDVGKTSLLELNSLNMSNSSTKETIINELEECFLLIPQSRILQREYRKKELAISFSFWSVFILTRYCDYVTMW